VTSVAAPNAASKNGKVLIDCSARGFQWKPLVAIDSLLPMSIALDQARVDCEPFATDQLLPYAVPQDGLEYATEEIALTEAAMPVLGER
jgi:hypothetical protein